MISRLSRPKFHRLVVATTLKHFKGPALKSWTSPKTTDFDIFTRLAIQS